MPAVQLPKITEAEFQRQVLALARLRGWRSAHFRPGMTRGGRWVTAVQGDGQGWPDLVLARRGRLVIAELKRQGQRCTPEQTEWLETLGTVPGVEVFCWRPSDWEEIERTLE
jgi:hypothetical protein